MQPPLPAFAKKKRFHTPILSPADLAKRRASKRIVRQFLDGNDTTFSNHSLRLLRRYIQARYSHALRKDPKHAQFTPKESAEIKKAHLWVVMGLEPNLKKNNPKLTRF
ncbi:MAG: hypothetical protein NTY48_02935 [Candidatus Diapherotrites archaeon]|nr:hypothetical protein [Candidatus Diapherotrites archaeon]